MKLYYYRLVTPSFTSRWIEVSEEEYLSLKKNYFFGPVEYSKGMFEGRVIVATDISITHD